MFSKGQFSTGLIGRIRYSVRSSLSRKSKVASMLDILRNKGALILSDSSAAGGFDAVAMYGSLTAGVIDARDTKELSLATQKDLLQRSMDMGFLALIVLHDCDVYPTMGGVIYWSAVVELLPEFKDVKKREPQYHFAQFEDN